MAIGEVSHVFYKLIIFYRVFTKLQIAFDCFKISNYFLRYDRSNLGHLTGSLWEEKTKTVKLDYFILNLSLPTFFKQSFSSFYSLIFIQ